MSKDKSQAGASSNAHTRRGPRPVRIQIERWHLLAMTDGLRRSGMAMAWDGAPQAEAVRNVYDSLLAARRDGADVTLEVTD